MSPCSLPIFHWVFYNVVLQLCRDVYFLRLMWSTQVLAKKACCVKWSSGALVTVIYMNSPLWCISTGVCRSVQCAKVRHGSRFHHRKWERPGLSRIRLTVLLRCGTETPERVPACLSQTRRPLIGRPFRSTGWWQTSKQTQYPRGVSGQLQSLLKKKSRKSLPSYIVACSLFIVSVLLYPCLY